MKEEMTRDELQAEIRNRLTEQFQSDPASEQGRKDLMMIFYMIQALKDVALWPRIRTFKVLRQIAMSAVEGIDDGRTSGYRVEGIDRDMGGFEYLAYYYVIAARVLPPEKVVMLGIGECKPAYDTARSFYMGQK